MEGGRGRVKLLWLSGGERKQDREKRRWNCMCVVLWICNDEERKIMTPSSKRSPLTWSPGWKWWHPPDVDFLVLCTSSFASVIILQQKLHIYWYRPKVMLLLNKAKSPLKKRVRECIPYKKWCIIENQAGGKNPYHAISTPMCDCLD